MSGRKQAAGIGRWWRRRSGRESYLEKVSSEQSLENRMELSQVERGKVFSDSLREEEVQQPENGWCAGKRPEVGMEKQHELNKEEQPMLKSISFIKLVRQFCRIVNKEMT